MINEDNIECHYKKKIGYPDIQDGQVEDRSPNSELKDSNFKGSSGDSILGSDKVSPLVDCFSVSDLRDEVLIGIEFDIEASNDLDIVIR